MSHPISHLARAQRGGPFATGELEHFWDVGPRGSLVKGVLIGSRLASCLTTVHTWTLMRFADDVFDVSQM